MNAYLNSIYINRFDNNFNRKIVSINGSSKKDLLKKIKKEKVKNGDIIYVNKRANNNYDYVNILGNVNIPGRFQYKEELNLGELINYAEGLKLDSLESAHVFRYLSDQRRELINVPVENTYFKLKNRDVVMILTKKIKRKHRRFQFWRIKTPGEFYFFEGMTINDALILSKPKQFASLYSIEVARFIKNKSKLIYVNNNEFSTFKLKPSDD